MVGIVAGGHFVKALSFRRFTSGRYDMTNAFRAVVSFMFSGSALARNTFLQSYWTKGVRVLGENQTFCNETRTRALSVNTFRTLLKMPMRQLPRRASDGPMKAIY